MKLLLLSTTKDFFGLHDITVRVNGKKDYTFTLTSDHDVEAFMDILKHHPGKALNYLKRVCIKQ